jgi:anthranilate synthase component I
MTESQFHALAAQGYNLIPLTLETLADLDTPLSAYVKLADQPFSYLLESVQGGERFGRYSFIGLSAATRIYVFGQRLQVMSGDFVAEEREEKDPLQFVDEYLQRFKVAEVPELPRFCGGLVGYFSYDTIRYVEPHLAKATHPDPLGVPDILLLLSTELVVLDNLSGKLHLIVYADPRVPNSYPVAQARLQQLRERLRQHAVAASAKVSGSSEPRSEFGEQAFKDAVARAKQYIFDGDVFQVVLSQRLSQSFPASPLSLYRALRTLNPSPYMFYYNFRDFHVVGASPEILVRLERDTVTVRPIAGTRKRGKTSAEDQALAEDLLTDPKELAEHVMLMDLGRNDIGRIAQIGSVRVTEKMVIERYSHVMHIVSNVDAKLKAGLGAIDVLRATFPAGTVSGAPKVRAMEIIDELEPSKRGVYAGAVGYIGFNGDMDLAIAIRTAVVKDKTLYVQAGAGIVADSVPENEWIETQNKARALLRAAEMALAGLDESA